jgi:class 3 adenylate cyclase
MRDSLRFGSSVTHLEKRDVVLLTVGLDAFTALTVRLDPERLAELLNSFYERMSSIVFSFEGAVTGFVGEEVRAIFGAPYDVNNPGIRAARAALAVRQEWSRFIAKRPKEERCELKVALHTGPVLAGTVGSDARLDYTALGSSVDTVAWLARTAKPGQIVVPASMVAPLRRQFELRNAGAMPSEAGAEVALFELVGENENVPTGPVKR